MVSKLVLNWSDAKPYCFTSLLNVLNEYFFLPLPIFCLRNQKRETGKCLTQLVKDQYRAQRKISKSLAMSYLSVSYNQFEIMKRGDEVMVWMSLGPQLISKIYLIVYFCELI